MSNSKSNDNNLYLNKENRQNNIKQSLITFFPNVIAKLISEYDYYLEGNSYTLEGHIDEVNCISVLPDGRIISGSYDKTLKIWNPSTGNCDHTFIGHTDAVRCIAILPNGRIISGSSDKTLKIWNLLTGNCDHTFTGHTELVWSVAILSNGRIVSGSYDKTIKIWS